MMIPLHTSRTVLILRILTLIVFALTVDYWLYPYDAPMPGRSANVGANGLWLRYTWYLGRYLPADVDALAGRLRDEQIRYAYFHVRSIERDGSLKYHELLEAQALTSTVHRVAPGVKVIAWVYAGNERGKGEVDMGNPSVRQKMVDEAVWLVDDCGFDGVQWDYEICPSGDHGFIDLLRETRAAMPPAKMLSVCTAVWMPGGFYGWTDDYFTDIARHCDQMTVMTYDTAAYFPRAYVAVMDEQVVHVSRAVATGSPSCRILFGIPTYVDGTRSHNPHAENVDLAIRGVRTGFGGQWGAAGCCRGVAVFADYTTTTGDWRDHRTDWLGR